MHNMQNNYYSTLASSISTSLLARRVVLLYLLASRTSRSVHRYSSMDNNTEYYAYESINLIFRVVVCVLATSVVL
jgi:hypothetical protein